MVKKNLDFTIGQRWMMNSIGAHSFNFCSDADACESQHSESDVKAVCEAAYSLLSNIVDEDKKAALRKAVYNAIRLQLSQITEENGVQFSGITCLFSGNDLTQVINSKQMKVAIKNAISSVIKLFWPEICAKIVGKGDDSLIFTETFFDAYAIFAAMLETGVKLNLEYGCWEDASILEQNNP